MEALRSNRPVVTEVRTFVKSGELRFVRVSAHPVWDERRGQLVGIYGAVEDITERRQAEAEREALVRELEAKNAELERFTYTVSHDLRSPLVTIQGFAGHIERDALAGAPERVAESARRISRAATTMGTLLGDLLELSRVGRLMNPPQTVPFGTIVSDALGLLSGTLTERGIRVFVEEPLPEVHGDRTRLTEVVQNLIENAAKFMGEQPDPQIRIGARAGDGLPLFFVKDNGIGIDPRFHEQVFGLFNKLDPASAGTGIGLTLVRRIVEVHGGTIRVESQGASDGTTVWFTLPPPPAQGEGAPGGTGR
jgi:signal transduction histidine kinase